jgi:hypothetical protein
VTYGLGGLANGGPLISYRWHGPLFSFSTFVMDFLHLHVFLLRALFLQFHITLESNFIDALMKLASCRLS